MRTGFRANPGLWWRGVKSTFQHISHTYYMKTPRELPDRIPVRLNANETHDNLEMWKTIFKCCIKCFFFFFFASLYTAGDQRPGRVDPNSAEIPEILLQCNEREAISRRWHSFPFRWGEKDEMGHLDFNISKTVRAHQHPADAGMFGNII